MLSFTSNILYVQPKDEKALFVDGAGKLTNFR
jgi:hypothetical protein